MQCTYKKSDGSTCAREAILDRGLCILHEDWEHKTIEETMKVFYRETEEGEGDFEGCIIPQVYLSHKVFKNGLDFAQAEIGGDAWFYKATIEGRTRFDMSEIKGDARFEEAKIEGDACFDGAEIKGDARFEGAQIKGFALFYRATIEGDARFDGAEIKGEAWFDGAEIKGDACFSGATIKGKALFDRATIGRNAFFERAAIEGDAWFDGAEIKGRATFGEVIFHHTEAEEEACRMAKMTQDRAGNRELADYHFYREMKAKRKRKARLIRWLESPLQYIFGYGVHPFWVIGWWFSVVVVIAFVYWLGNGVQEATSFGEHLYFSVVTAATPGYGGYKPEPGGFQILATIQAIFGTFMWAAFIVTFARKFMR